MTIVLAVLAAASGPAGGSAYPVEAVLDDARSACAVALNGEAVDNELVSAGWAAAEPIAGSWLAEELSERWDSVGTSHRQFVKDSGGRQLYVIFGMDRDTRFTQSICTVREPRAVLRSDGARIVQWAGRAPVAPAFAMPDLKGLDDVGFRKLWNPGLNDNSDETQINYAKGFGLTYYAVRIEEGTEVQ